MISYIARYPNDDAAILAQKILDYIDVRKEDGLSLKDPVSALVKDSSLVSTSSSAIAQQQKEEEPIFNYQEGVPHLYVIAVKTDNLSVSRVKFNVINYNLEYFSNFNFDIQEKPFNKKFGLVVVKPLVDNRQGMNYYDLATISDELFEGFDKSNIEHFIISESNFTLMQKDMRIDKYLEFFYQYYIK